MNTKSAPADREMTGPFDISEVSAVQPFIDLGAIKVTPRTGLQLRLDIEEATKRLVAATFDIDGSTLQVQVFAAPRTEGLWNEIREQVAAQVVKQGGKAEHVVGPFGPEVRAAVPTADGSKRPVRFVGVDGPKWFLRGVISGPAADTDSRAAVVEDVFRSIVVNRGTEALPPRELLTLRVPPQPGTVA
ncbi:MAG: DUF3710 domain-containing protein [Microbacteriaceae bacterium]|nr:DUF3710 domain-containing protein [Microbacteriaceae bacterium]